MSHEIIKNVDTLLVPNGAEYNTWHGLETVSPNRVITVEEVEQLDIHPTVISGPTKSEINGIEVDLPDYQTLIAQKNNGHLYPLHIAKNKYSIIQNRTVWDTMTAALEGIDIPNKVTCVGTLGGLKKYFISVAVGEDGGGFEVNGDKFYGNINFITSHDGSMAFRAIDSNIRCVCANTIQMAISGEKNIDFKMYHKGDVAPVAASLGSYLNSILKGREVFKEAMEKFHAIQVADSDIEKIVGGYFLMDAYSKGNKLSEGFATRTRNAISGISELARKGRGNNGETVYDVLNGFTEYYTSGDGVGRTTGEGKRAYSSEFGTASMKKTEFGKYLLNDRYTDKVDEVERVLALTN